MILFEIAICRCSLEDYTNKIKEKKEKYIQYRQAMGLLPEQPYVFPSWRFNEIIGWVTISIWNNRICGESWLKERIIKGSSTYVFRYRGKLFSCSLVGVGLTSDDIYNKIKRKLRSSFEEQFPKYHLDLTTFDNLGPSLNWLTIREKSTI